MNIAIIEEIKITVIWSNFLCDTNMSIQRCSLTKGLLILLIIATYHQNSNCDAHVSIHQRSAEEDYFANDMEQDTTKQLLVPKDHKLVERLPLNILQKYTSYKDVSILHFRVPQDTRTAAFAFKAYEETKSSFRPKCKPKSVEVHLKPKSYPVISPENITFPKYFLPAEQRCKAYSLHFQSNEEQQHILIDSPNFGDWYAVAFISWTDPNNDRIEQQGLASSCDTFLLAELSILRSLPPILYDGLVQNDVLTLCNDSNTDHGSEIIYKFYAPRYIESATAVFSIAEDCNECPAIAFSIQSNAFPMSINNDNESEAECSVQKLHVIKPNEAEDVTLNFYVQPESWHYIRLEFFKNKTLQNVAAQLNGSLPIQIETVLNNEENEADCQQIKYNLQINLQTSPSSSHNESNENDSNLNSTTNIMDIDNLPSNESLINRIAIEWLPKKFRNIDFYPLLRQTYREFFTFDYDLMPDENGTVPMVLNLTSAEPAGFAFELGDVYDIGGTLSFAISMKPEIESDATEFKNILSLNNDKRENIPNFGKESSKEGTSSSSNQTIIVCMHLTEPALPIWPDKCQYGTDLLPASSIVNNTDLSSSTGIIHVPFPESGQWYITMALYCNGLATARRATPIDNIKQFLKLNINYLYKMNQTCACSSDTIKYAKCIASTDCLASMNETEILAVKDCFLDPKCTPDYLDLSREFENQLKLATAQNIALKNCNTSLVFTISSSPCVVGRCGRFGRCYHYMSGGFVFSTCVCTKGYRGWDCTEDSQVPSSISILTASLLLILSNLLFLPSIYISVRRNYYTEATTYFFAMFFSIFYHACDSGEEEYSFCLVKLGVLQFCDFYCGLLSIWVTLIAMSGVRQQFVSVLHIFGAILLAFGTELNKQSLWVFLAPALTGIIIISTSWGIRCFSSRKWYPLPRYLAIYLPLGAILVIVGLICYAFLQTKQNYYIIHSIWHILMALSILCLLPSRKYLISKC
ncbi:uncharacterized protein LOC101456267 isoform X1 [Ceratitis capitata]|uniref:uncharacterized protein LOC101456267 isoform X1 n=2 Tax=Ceratitis capitata TaxID=7213 RepID=UPI00032A020B|nr:uncharacterized protein LOC101456267 isoform X1 [Ceratitis capitata]XP_020714054.1 uncharacterized protein LOC101456267 isoform X1 [Ceratitis capitata]